MNTSLITLQQKILQWIEYEGFITWHDVHKASQNLLQYENLDDREFYGKYPEYKLFYPLLRNGCVEICENNGVLGFKYVWNWKNNVLPEITIDPLKVLESFPDIKAIIKTFPDYSSKIIPSSLRFKSDLLWNYKLKPNELKYTGIYQNEDLPGQSAYLYDQEDETIRYIPTFSSKDSYEAINIARIYCRKKLIQNLSDFKYNKNIFSYNKENQELTINNYNEYTPSDGITIYKNWGNEIPTIVMRALILFCTDQLLDANFYINDFSNLIYKNVPEKAYIELKRIFGESND